jgi:hypothetical protein
MDGTLHEVMACTHALTTVNDQLIGKFLFFLIFYKYFLNQLIIN